MVKLRESGDRLRRTNNKIYHKALNVTHVEVQQCIYDAKEIKPQLLKMLWTFVQLFSLFK